MQDEKIPSIEVADDPHISSNDIEVHANALNDDITTNETEPILMGTVESEVAETNISANDIKEDFSVVQNIDVSNTEDVKKLINDLYTENFIEEASDSFIADYFGFNLSRFIF